MEVFVKIIDELNSIRDFACVQAEFSSLIAVHAYKVESTLVPRIKLYLKNRKESGWQPIGAELGIYQEAGLNLFFSVINFCYRDPVSGREYVYDKVVKRSTGLLMAMAESNTDWNDFAMVSRLDAHTWSEMIQLSTSNPFYLGEDRGVRLVMFAAWLLSKNIKSMAEFLRYSGNDALIMTKILKESGLFKDRFLKRAQFGARAVSDVLMRRTGKPLRNIEHLTVMADYRIPQVFYNLDSLVSVIDSSLLAKLISHEVIEFGSAEEVALRSTAVYIGNLAAKIMGVTEAEMDGYLWGLSQEMAKNGEMKIPHMLVATDAY